MATAPPPRRPEPSGHRGGRRELGDPDEAAADRAAEERRSIEEALDLSGAGEDVTQRQLDRVTILRLREDLRRTEARLRRVQRDNDRLRANDYRTQHEAREEGRRELRPEVERLRTLVEDLKGKKRQLEDDKRYRELERSFEERFGRADTSVGRELLGMLKEHGPDLLPQFVQQCMTLMQKQAGPGDGASEANALPGPAALKAALERARQAGPPTQAERRPEQPDPRPNPTEQPMQRPAHPHTSTPPPAAEMPEPEQPEPTAAEATAGFEHLPTDPDQAFVEVATRKGFAALDAEISVAEFASEIRAVMDGLAESAGFEASAATFARLTERLIPGVARRSAAPEDVATLLLPFAADLPPMALRVMRSMPAQLLKQTVIDPAGVDYQGHDALLLDVLESLKAQLSQHAGVA